MNEKLDDGIIKRGAVERCSIQFSLIDYSMSYLYATKMKSSNSVINNVAYISFIDRLNHEISMLRKLFFILFINCYIFPHYIGKSSEWWLLRQICYRVSFLAWKKLLRKKSLAEKRKRSLWVLKNNNFFSKDLANTMKWYISVY